MIPYRRHPGSFILMADRWAPDNLGSSRSATCSLPIDTCKNLLAWTCSVLLAASTLFPMLLLALADGVAQ